jgi:ribosomal protein L11 methyltransferase
MGEKMYYTEVKLYTESEIIDPLSCVLEDIGIAGFIVEDPMDIRELLNKKHDYEWDYIDESILNLIDRPPIITFYLEDNTEGLKLLDRVLEEIIIFPIEKVELKSICDEDWKNNWKKYFKPVKITERITVKPSWEPYSKESDDELIIEIDPGMAFGTGTHPTTSLCIKLIEKYIKNGSKKVLDIGCGSGILSIAAALLGANEVIGVEIDPNAVAVAKENVAKNSLDSVIHIIEGDLTKDIDNKSDIVVANLMAGLVIRLSENVAEHLNKGGIYISSGILIEKQDQVISAIRACGFEVIEIVEDGEWCAIVAQY